MTEVYPPYWHSYGDVSRSSSGDGQFSDALHFNADKNTGQIDTFNQNIINLPGDSASYWTEVYAAMHIIYVAESPGRARVNVTIRSAENPYLVGSLDDESGNSNATVRQYSDLHMWFPNTTGPVGFIHPLASYRRGGTGGSWNFPFAHPRMLTLIFEKTYQKGEWFMIGLLIQDRNHIWVNDMESYAEVKNSLIISKVDVSMF